MTATVAMMPNSDNMPEAKTMKAAKPRPISHTTLLPLSTAANASLLWRKASKKATAAAKTTARLITYARRLRICNELLLP